jgi:hypothetical protein
MEIFGKRGSGEQGKRILILKGTGFSPYVKQSGINGALAPEGFLARIPTQSEGLRLTISTFQRQYRASKLSLRG